MLESLCQYWIVCACGKKTVKSPTYEQAIDRARDQGWHWEGRFYNTRYYCPDCWDNEGGHDDNT